MRPDFVAYRMEDGALLNGISDLRKKERKLQAYFIAYLSEIDKRKLYARDGFSSLAKFMIEKLGYSEHSAWKRIQIARASRRIPQIYYLLLDAKVSLGSLSKVCAHLKQSNADSLLKEIEGKSVRETERVVARRFPKSDVADSIRQSATPLSVDRVYFRFSASTTFEQRVKRAKDLLSHKCPEGRLEEIFGEALDALIEKLEKPRREVATQVNLKRFLRIDHIVVLQLPLRISSRFPSKGDCLALCPRPANPEGHCF